jgi:hypothetical protein
MAIHFQPYFVPRIGFILASHSRLAAVHGMARGHGGKAISGRRLPCAALRIYVKKCRRSAV